MTRKGVGPFVPLSGHGGRWRVLFPTITITDVWVDGCRGGGKRLLFLLALAFVLRVVVWAAALALCGVVSTSAFAAAALSIPYLSLVGGGIAAGVESCSAAAGRIRG